ILVRNSSHEPSVTKTGARLASSVALATAVICSARCQAARSAARKTPGNINRTWSRSPAGRSSAAATDKTFEASMNGSSASATRQKAVAIGPTSDRRTKIGEPPIAAPPTRRAISASRLLAREAAVAEVDDTDRIQAVWRRGSASYDTL